MSRDCASHGIGGGDRPRSDAGCADSRPVLPGRRGTARLAPEALMVRAWYEVLIVGRLRLAAMAAAVAAILVLGWIGTAAERDPLVFTVVVEGILALAAGMLVAYQLAVEPALEVQLSAPLPYRGTLLIRLGVVMTLAALLGVGASLLAVALGKWQPEMGVVLGQLLWLAPVALFSFGAAAVALLTASRTIAAGAVGGTWLFAQIAFAWWLSHEPTRLIYPFASTHGIPSAEWVSNRLFVLAAALLLGAIAAASADRPERLLARHD